MRWDIHVRVLVLAAVALYATAGRQARAADEADVRARECRLDVGPNGALHIKVGDDLWVEQSSYSFAGASIRRNWLSKDRHECEAPWTPDIKPAGDKVT